MSNTKKLATLDSLYNEFHKLHDIKVAPKLKINFCDGGTQQYTGITEFSINLKKRDNVYRVYMSPRAVDACLSVNSELTVCDNLVKSNGGRTKYIDFAVDQLALLKQCMNAVMQLVQSPTV